MITYIKIDNETDDEKNVTVSFAADEVMEATVMTLEELKKFIND